MEWNIKEKIVKINLKAFKEIRKPEIYKPSFLPVEPLMGFLSPWRGQGGGGGGKMG